MLISRRTLLGSATVAAALPSVRTRAAAKPVIKLGQLSDMSGPYSAETGQGITACVEQAIAEFKADNKDFDVQLITADTQNKADISLSLARKWLDREGVDVIVDGGNSAISLAIGALARQKDKVLISFAAGTPDLTGKGCNPNTLHWSYDTYMLGRSTGEALVKAGGDKWYFITADYVFGHDLQNSAARFIKAGGGKVVGTSLYPFPDTTDFSSYLALAQASGANVVGLANSGTDTIACLKQAREFNIAHGGVRVAALLLDIIDIHSIGLPSAQGAVLTESFYWDLNDRTRAFTKRVLPRMQHGFRPDMMQAGGYSALRHYLKAVARLGPNAAKASGAAAVAEMKKMPVEDDVFGTTTIRADGRHMMPAYLFQVKTPAESKQPWDYYKLLATTPADEAAVPVAETGCYLDKA